MIPLRDQPAAFLVALVGLNVLSVLDWVMTSHELAFGAQEGNLLIRALLELSPAGVVAFKISWMLALTALIWRSRRYRLVIVATVAALAAYTVLMVYHVAGMVSIGAL